MKLESFFEGATQTQRQQEARLPDDSQHLRPFWRQDLSSTGLRHNGWTFNQNVKDPHFSSTLEVWTLKSQTLKTYECHQELRQAF